MPTEFETDLYRNDEPEDRAPARRDGLSLSKVEAREVPEAEEYATAYNEFLGREITFHRPNEVSFTLFQQDMNSSVLGQAEKLGIAGDYFRGIMKPQDFQDYYARVNREARALGPKAAARFFEVLGYMTEFFHDHMVEQDEDAVNRVQSRTQRRAEERARARAVKRGKDAREQQ